MVSAPQASKTADTILSWQSKKGSWPKNVDTTDKPFTGNPENLQGTFDNGATTGEIRFLYHIYKATGNKKYYRGFVKGLNHILEAQYPSGGWPQFYPPGNDYHRHITFNDDVMINIMNLLKDITYNEDYKLAALRKRKAAKKAFRKGVDCILECQVKVNGKLTVWCAQHDEENFKPRKGRSYEPPSLSGAESAGILKFLMEIENPSPEIIKAVEAGIKWFKKSKVTGIKIVRNKKGNRVAIKDSNAPALWARFYEIETNRPIFSDRDGVITYDYNRISAERRNGYAWYGDWGKSALSKYEEWREGLNENLHNAATSNQARK